ncbi:hypothetical protein KI387_035494, partial [Taxus chinensis]
DSVACKSACINQYDPEYCNTYGCCEAGIPPSRRMVNFTGGGNCGFSTILDPLTWTLRKNELGIYARGCYGLRLDWSISRSNCSQAKGTSSYSCADKAECINKEKVLVRNTPDNGHACKCLRGYEGDGYSNGTSCMDVDECRHTDSNQCVEPQKGGICHNFPGSYNCSCAKHYIGDGFKNGTRCESK